MITFEQMSEALSDKSIAGLDVSVFSDQDVVNLILQRSEIIRDQRRPGKIVADWTEGNETPALALVDKMGDTLIRRAAAFIWLEYQQIKPALTKLPRPPAALADIGCGYAFFDLFFWRDFPGKLFLIDLEQTEERHFGFRDQGAAYSNLDVARRFLVSNGVAGSDVLCVNPKHVPLSAAGTVDLAVSFISCGFHYPWELYEAFFRDQVAPDGTIILDLRMRKAEAGKRDLTRIGEVSELTKAAYGNAARLMVRKSQP